MKLYEVCMSESISSDTVNKTVLSETRQTAAKREMSRERSNFKSNFDCNKFDCTLFIVIHELLFCAFDLFILRKRSA